MRLTDLVTPLKPLEAMAQGKLLVASDVGGHRELIRDGETGALFRPAMRLRWQQRSVACSPTASTGTRCVAPVAPSSRPSGPGRAVRRAIARFIASFCHLPAWRRRRPVASDHRQTSTCAASTASSISTAPRRPGAHGAWATSRATAAPTIRAGTSTAPAPSACAACRSSTSPAATSRCPTRTRRCGSSATARSTTFASCATSWPAPGHRFKTGSDSEVILHVYEEWGDDFVLRLNGMFGFALWDATRRRLLIGRDRLGIKPIYWSQDGQRLVFATEAKAILALPGVSTARRSRPRWPPTCKLGYVPAPQSMFEGIRKLPSATLLSVEARQLPQWRVLALPDDSRTAAVSEGEWIERMRAAASSRPCACRWSATCRSAPSCPAASIPARSWPSWPSAARQPVKTYAIGFDGAAAESLYNELPYARRVAELFGTDHHEIVVQPDVVALLPRLLWHMDEPIADTAFITTYLVSEFARRDVTVILSGVGGDELFGGYRRYLGNHYPSASPPAGGSAAAAKGIGRMLPTDRHSPMLNIAAPGEGFPGKRPNCPSRSATAPTCRSWPARPGRPPAQGGQRFRLRRRCWKPSPAASRTTPCNRMLAVDMAYATARRPAAADRQDEHGGLAGVPGAAARPRTGRDGRAHAGGDQDQGRRLKHGHEEGAGRPACRRTSWTARSAASARRWAPG